MGRAQGPQGSLGLEGTSLVEHQMEACQIHQVAHQGTAQVRQGIHLEGQTGSGMDLLGRQGQRRVDSRLAGTAHVERNSAAVAVAGLVERYL